MNRWLNGARWALGVAMLGGALSLGGFGLIEASTSQAWAQSGYGDDDDDEQEYGEREMRKASEVSGRPVASLVAANTAAPLYAEECGACHLAYPAPLLPARSWQQLMAGLDDHFGENAELPMETAQQISAWLVSNAADVNPGRRSTQFLRGIASSDTPLRITDTPFFKRKHDEVPASRVTGNPQVGSFSQCQACHGQAAQRGVFDEDTVDIPGYGRWD